MSDNIAMTKEQYELVMNEIIKNHSWGNYPDFYWKDEDIKNRYKMIKYVRPNWDMRDGMCFTIKFEPCDKQFGSGYGETMPMYDRIIEWLNTPRKEVSKG